MNKYNSFLCAALALLLAGCQIKASDKNETEKPLVYPVVKLSQSDTFLHSNYVAAIEARQNVEIRTKISGYLEKILVDEGREVKQGDLLFQINDKELRMELEKAQAALTSAKAEARAASLEVARVKLLVDKKIISATEQQLAEAKEAVAKAKIIEAQSVVSNAATRLSYTSIRAPFSGVIDRIPLKLGSLVGEGALLTTVSDLSFVHAYFSVSENEYLHHIKSRKHTADSAWLGDVQLQLADGSLYPYPGKIETGEGEFDKGTGAIAFRAKFPNPSKVLKHGATGKIIITNDVAEALLVPQKAVFEIQDKNYVFVVDQANIVHQQNFIPKQRIGAYYIVQSGLAPGDVLVYEGIQTIKDGTKIAPKY